MDKYALQNNVTDLNEMIVSIPINMRKPPKTRHKIKYFNDIVSEAVKVIMPSKLEICEFTENDNLHNSRFRQALKQNSENI